MAMLTTLSPQELIPSVPPEALLKASVLMAMYSIRSERAFCERLNYDLLFKWFLDMRIDQPAFDATTFSKNRQRLLDHDVADGGSGREALEAARIVRGAAPVVEVIGLHIGDHRDPGGVLQE